MVILQYDTLGHLSADDIAEVSPSNSVAFSWWCICQLSQLYGFSEEGRQLASQVCALSPHTLSPSHPLPSPSPSSSPNRVPSPTLQESQCHPNWEYIHHLLPHTFHRVSTRPWQHTHTHSLPSPREPLSSSCGCACGTASLSLGCGLPPSSQSLPRGTTSTVTW